MLILRRKEGQWIEITHKSGDKIRVRVCNIRARYPGQLDLVLDDPDHHFLIQRAERGTRPQREAIPTAGGEPCGHTVAPQEFLETHPSAGLVQGLIPVPGIGAVGG